MGLFSAGTSYRQESSKSPLIVELGSSATTTTQEKGDKKRQPEHFHQPLIEVVGSTLEGQEDSTPAHTAAELPSGSSVPPLIQELDPCETETMETAHLLTSLEHKTPDKGDHVSSPKPLIVELDSPTEDQPNSDDVTATASMSRPFLAPSDSPKVSHGGVWATPLVHPPPREAPGKQTRSEDLLVQDITDEEIGEVGSSPPDYSHVRLAEIPLIKNESEIQEADAVLRRLKTKPRADWTPEERVWYLAAQGGSSIEGEQVELDAQTKARVKERLSEAGVLDNVSLSF